MLTTISIIIVFFLLILIGYLKFNYKAIEASDTNISYGVATENYKKVDVINLLVWNIHKEANEKIFIDDISYLVNEFNINFILLQEFNTKTIKVQSDFVKEYNCIFAPNTLINLKSELAGVMTCSYFLPKSLIILRTKNKEPITNTPKICLVSKYLTKNKFGELMIINIHAINFEYGIKYFKKQINNILLQMEKHIGPIIIAGDFNTWNHSRISYLRNIMMEANMKEVKFDDNTSSIFGYPIDHVFYSKKYLMPIYSTVISNLKSSDHNALIVKFEFI